MGGEEQSRGAMNITIAVPKGQVHRKRQIEHELTLARNIQAQENKLSIQDGLLKILTKFKDGQAYLWNGTELFIYEYPLNIYIYHCGNSFVVPDASNSVSRYLLVVMDADEVNVAMLVGKCIKPIWNKQSNVQRKHDAGGQSQRRFERGRAEALKKWMKEIGTKLKEMMQNDRY